MLNSSIPETLSSSNQIDCLVVLDRHIDMVTPLLTQLTYEGLINELIGIKNCLSIYSYYIITH